MNIVAKEEATDKSSRVGLVSVVRQRLKYALTHRNVCFHMYSPAGFMDGVVVVMATENDTVPVDAETGKSWIYDNGLPQFEAVMSSSSW